ncbi:serine incorporator-domain-containing protein [Russula earlei]|uniref:Serine incorporator-domain-containing protein n=1 Tax=Russula earlei TaxID=71964 RepID=A0ACC0UF07_9AGAM|nr:serine incorporator-domain-containing protein [Russula earlei]
MGLLRSLPLTGVLATIGSSCIAGLAFCFTSAAGVVLTDPCGCNSSIATRIGFAMIFALDSMLAWLMKTPLVIQLIEKWTYDYIKMDCEVGKCHGVLAVHRLCLALALFYVILGVSAFGSRDTCDKRAAIRSGWWGPKGLLWLVSVITSFFIPNHFFIFWGNYGAAVFVLLGLVLAVVYLMYVSMTKYFAGVSGKQSCKGER